MGTMQSKTAEGKSPAPPGPPGIDPQPALLAAICDALGVLSVLQELSGRRAGPSTRRELLRRLPQCAMQLRDVQSQVQDAIDAIEDRIEECEPRRRGGHGEGK